ncbi:hypothetical protein ACFX11_003749 [Malus domestica]
MPCPSGQSISRHSSCVSQKTLRIQLVHSHLLPSTYLLHSITSAFVSLSLLRAPLEDYNFSFLSYKHEGRVEAGQKRFLSASGYVAVSPHQRPVRHSVVCEVATKKPDSAVKRDRQAEKRRIYNKSQKSEIKTRMK